jgi:hypothetical protein
MTAAAFEEWAERAGKAQVERFAKEQTFSFVLGKGRAKRKLERRYSETFASETLLTAVDDAISRFPSVLAAIALRCKGVALFRGNGVSDDLVVLPREPVSQLLERYLIVNLRASAELAEAAGLAEIVLRETAVGAEQELFRATGRNAPLLVGDLVFVETDATYMWPGWAAGHYYVLAPPSFRTPKRKDLRKGDYKKSAGEQVMRKKSELGRVDADGKAKAVAALSEVLDGTGAPVASI